MRVPVGEGERLRRAEGREGGLEGFKGLKAGEAVGMDGGAVGGATSGAVAVVEVVVAVAGLRWLWRCCVRSSLGHRRC